MPYVRVAHRAAVHRPVNRRTPTAPRLLPILQPPTFSLKSEFIYEDEQQQQQKQNEKRNYPVIVDHAHGRKITQPISVRVPTYISQQNYLKRLLLRLLTRPIRHAEPKYSSHIYSTQ